MTNQSKKGVSILSVISVRREPKHTAEMVTQVLFGECFEVLESIDEWLHIRISYDGYTGFIPNNQFTEIPDELYNQYCECSSYAASQGTLAASECSFPISIGSSLQNIDRKGLLTIDNQSFLFSGKYNQEDTSLESICLQFLNAPYLWGGKSLFGIDCSGFVQVCFRAIGINLPRDAWQQQECGNLINNIDDVREGDLAFFQNAEGKIIHVGIVLKYRQIIHASGCVRIDNLTPKGLFNKHLKVYTHLLHSIKRVLPQ